MRRDDGHVQGGLRRLSVATGALTLWVLIGGAMAVEPPRVLGHRGIAWDHPRNPYPENSVASVRAALAAGAHGVEVDVFKTRDDVFVLAHEEVLESRRRWGRRSNCRGRITEADWDAIRRCRIRPGLRTAATQPLARLEQIIDLPGLDLLLVDVKNDSKPVERLRTIDQLARIVRGFEAADRVILMLYTSAGLRRAHRWGLRACHKRHDLRGTSEAAAVDELARLGVWGQCANPRLVHRRTMARLRAAGIEQVPYLLGHEISDRILADTWRRFGALGVTAIITDRVPAAVLLYEAAVGTEPPHGPGGAAPTP